MLYQYSWGIFFYKDLTALSFSPLIASKIGLCYEQNSIQLIVLLVCPQGVC